VQPFDRQDINDHILQYLHSFAHFPDVQIAETWHGIYPKLLSGAPYFIHEAAPAVRIVNGLGGAGMTMSFGLAQKFDY
jgi:glycine/D-amino acid oxidase-like deaminating enzyme